MGGPWQSRGAQHDEARRFRPGTHARGTCRQHHPQTSPQEGAALVQSRVRIKCCATDANTKLRTGF